MHALIIGLLSICKKISYNYSCLIHNSCDLFGDMILISLLFYFSLFGSLLVIGKLETTLKNVKHSEVRSILLVVCSDLAYNYLNGSIPVEWSSMKLKFM